MPVSIEAGADELVARDGDVRIGTLCWRTNRLHGQRGVLGLGGEGLRARGRGVAAPRPERLGWSHHG